MLIDHLDYLGKKFGTDKSSLVHNYLKFYQQFFDKLRCKENFKMLEIGVHNGASLHMWNEYFDNAELIVGMDINPETTRFQEGHIVIEIADQSNIDSLVSLGNKYGAFDVVIDDGSHIWDHQIISFQYLFPFVKDSGYYIIEDLATGFDGYIEAYKGSRGVMRPISYLLDIANYVVGAELSDIQHENDVSIRTLAPLIRAIHLYRFTALIERK
jgi:hypothetical protein